MFDSSSRYASVDDYTVPDSRGRSVKIKKIRFIPKTPATLTRQVVQGDRQDLLAYLYYQAPERFWRIADGNEVMDPAELVAQIGELIRIPPRS
jgi:hypothetical protein